MMELKTAIGVILWFPIIIIAFAIAGFWCCCEVIFEMILKFAQFINDIISEGHIFWMRRIEPKKEGEK